MKPTAALRKILEGSELTMGVAAHDPLLARLVQKAGYQMVAVSGNAVAAFHLGLPDMGFTNLGDIVDVSGRIAAAVDLPVLVDADTGFGNAMNVLRTVREFERAGVAGIILEDQVDYKKCSMIETAHPVVTAEDHAAKISAACRARRDSDFVIVARTDSAADLGLEEAIRRARIYAEAGADMVDIQILGTREQIRQIAEANLPVPLKGNMDEGKRLWEIDFPTLEAAGYRVASYPGLIRYTIVRAVKEALDHLKAEGTTAGIRDKMSTVKEYFDAVDLDRYLDLEKEIFPQSPPE